MGRGQPALGLLGEDELVRRAPWLVAALLLLAGCGGTTAPSGTPSPSETPTQAVAAPTPKEDACHQLAYDQAVAPTAPDATVPCSGRHTSQTYAVGRLDRVVDGHLLAVSSDRVQHQISGSCPDALAHFLGGSEDDVRLSLLRSVWFTPSDGQAAAGANWYRCDVVAVSGPQQLAQLSGSLHGVLSSGRADDYALCGTAKPGTADFRRVACSEHHSWQAVSIVHFSGADYPGQGTVEAAGTSPCKDAARARASDTLNYQWGYDWPSKEQWDAGQTYGVCWAEG